MHIYIVFYINKYSIFCLFDIYISPFLNMQELLYLYNNQLLFIQITNNGSSLYVATSNFCHYWNYFLNTLSFYSFAKTL